jgi:hypothetical protein
MTEKAMFVVKAEWHERGHCKKSVVCGYIGDVARPELNAIDLITQHATEQEIDVCLSAHLLMGGVGMVAEQFKYSAPKTRWVYFLDFTDISF